MSWRDWHNIVIFGGSFDPPHAAHVVQPRLACQHIGGDGVLYVPAGQAPHKRGRQQTSAKHRLAMLKLALADVANVEICTWELDRGEEQPSYTVDTLAWLKDQVGEQVNLHLLIGADMMLIFDQWHQAQRITQLARVWVMVRPPQRCEDLLEHLPRAGDAGLWRESLIDLPPMAISSSEIRRAVARGETTPQLSPTVRAYIDAHQLYQGML